ncbi:Flp family type IVb pilin [Sphingopyxis yananensis]|uniref:Flp family type IVb pilin n=1 Tax=Sphingopyxis yananensis TaxID=2886687 RepID=UPI001D10C56B|nr:Flp family type IVb pilin [Sphingopyxis yananensis]MCC2602570.1 Flp family type IVb pilin [Sphingopyxis yananensis]
MKKIKNFGRDTEAATAIEYGLIAALIAIAAIAAMGVVGGGVKASFKKAGDALSTEANKTPSAT